MEYNDLLIRAFQEKNDKLIRPFYLRIREKYLRINRGRMDQDSLIEIYQDGFVRLFEAAQKGKLTNLTGDLEGYLLGICRHLYAARVGEIMAGRSAQGQDGLLELLTEESDEYEPMEEQEQAVRNALDRLGMQCQKILRAFYYLGWTMEKISKELQYPNPETAKSQKYRCIQHLKKIIKTNGRA